MPRAGLSCFKLRHRTLYPFHCQPEHLATLQPYIRIDSSLGDRKKVLASYVPFWYIHFVIKRSMVEFSLSLAGGFLWSLPSA